jgi:hypothetical protein
MTSNEGTKPEENNGNAQQLNIHGSPLSGQDHTTQTTQENTTSTQEGAEEKQPLPRFPTEIFPEQLDNVIESLYDKQSYPRDFTASAFLYAASIAAGRGYYVDKPFKTYPLVFLAISALSGKIKSHPLRFAVKPIEAWNAYYYDQYKREKAEWDKRGEEAANEPKPKLQARSLEDVTPEALTETLYYNQRGLGLTKPELAAWFGQFDRYSGNAEETFYLKTFDCDSTYNRRKNGEDYYIPETFVSVAGTIQLSKLAKLAANDRAVSGFLDRVLITAPDNVKAPRFGDNYDITGLEDTWAGYIDAIEKESAKRFNSEKEGASCVPFEEDAYPGLTQRMNKISDSIDQAEGKGEEVTVQQLAKLQTYMPRFALLLALLRDPRSPSITLEDVKGAKKLVDYFEAHGRKARAAAGLIDQVDRKALAKQLRLIGHNNNNIATILNMDPGNISKILNGKR